MIFALGTMLRARSRRVIGLLAFGGLFLLAGVTARVVAGHEGHVEAERLFLIGGYPLVSVLLLLGWLIARFPMIAALVLLSGVISEDRASGFARLVHVRPRSRLVYYGTRVSVFALLAFVVSSIVVPLFDFLILGRWSGWAAVAVIGAHVLVYGSVTVLFSVFTRADAWIALFVALFAIVWDALRTAGAVANAPPGVREALTLLLPPQGALNAIEAAFAQMQPVPMPALGLVAFYSLLLVVIAGLLLERREI
jgi:hypothetical protein